MSTPIILAVWTTFLVLSSGWQLYNRESKRRLREQIEGLKTALTTAETTVALASAEKQLVADSNARLSLERDEHLKKIAALEARTDLGNLSRQISEHHAEVMKETAALNLRVSQTLQQNNRELVAGFGEHAAKDNAVLERLASLQEGTQTLLGSLDLRVAKMEQVLVNGAGSIKR